jgi:hypothetical protein
MKYAAEIRSLCDGTKTYKQIAQTLGVHLNTVQRTAVKLGLPRREIGGVKGVGAGINNSQYKCGRIILRTGYAQVLAPPEHPNRLQNGYILEHRLVCEQKLGRYLLPEEVVDHIDALRMHNHPDNLRVFATNADHLRETLTGVRKQWSSEGLDRIRTRNRPDANHTPVNKYRQAVKSGDFVLHQILLAALKLGTDSPYLLGSSLHTTKAGIDLYSRSTIERALDDLCLRWGLPRTL